MTRTQAWRKVAEAFATSPEKRTELQQRLSNEGMCWALIRIEGWEPESPTNSKRRLEIVEAVEAVRIRDFGSSQDEYWPPYRVPEGDAFRATFAALMAAMTQRERDQLVKGL